MTSAGWSLEPNSFGVRDQAPEDAYPGTWERYLRIGILSEAVEKADLGWAIVCLMEDSTAILIDGDGDGYAFARYPAKDLAGAVDTAFERYG